MSPSSDRGSSWSFYRKWSKSCASEQTLVEAGFGVQPLYESLTSGLAALDWLVLYGERMPLAALYVRYIFDVPVIVARVHEWCCTKFKRLAHTSFSRGHTQKDVYDVYHTISEMCNIPLEAAGGVRVTN